MTKLDILFDSHNSIMYLNRFLNKQLVDLSVDKLMLDYFKLCGQAQYSVSTIVYTVCVKSCTMTFCIHPFGTTFSTRPCNIVVSYSFPATRWPPLGHLAHYFIRNKYKCSTLQVDWNKDRSKL